MSDLDEVPELDAESKAFLDRHQRTGEPSTEALESARLRLTAAPPSVAPAPVVRLAPRRRPFLPPEVTAAAAVVTLLLCAQAMYLWWNSASAVDLPAPAEVNNAVPDADLKAVANAWRAGEFMKASRLASQNCQSPACSGLAKDLAKMVGLAQHVETLTDDEADQLATFDKKLSGGRDTALSLKLEARALPPEPPPVPEAPLPEKTALAEVVPHPNEALAAQLFDEAYDLKRTKNFERAVVRLNKCIKLSPSYPPCYRLLGSTYASIATRDQSAADMEKARRYYEQFLELAPPDDDYVPKVTAILEAAKGSSSSTRAEDVGPGELELTVGGSMTIPLIRKIGRVALGDPTIANVSVLGPDSLRIEGIKPGKTTILAWFADTGRVSMGVTVRPSNNADDRADQLLIDASMARASNDYATAYRHLHSLLQLDPGNEGAARMMLELKSSARELYLRGYLVKESNPREALRLFKQVELMTLPSDETHQKAASRVREFEQR